MPTVICSYCQYVGSGNNYEERIVDVVKHEKCCPERISYEIADAFENKIAELEKNQ